MGDKMGDIGAKVNDSVNEKVNSIVNDVTQKLDTVVQEKQAVLEEQLNKVDSNLKQCCVIA
jgi:hypothetical protein